MLDHPVCSSLQQALPGRRGVAVPFHKADGNDLQVLSCGESGLHIIDHIAHVPTSRVGDPDLLNHPQQGVGMGFRTPYFLTDRVKETRFFLLALIERDNALEVREKSELPQSQFGFELWPSAGDSQRQFMTKGSQDSPGDQELFPTVIPRTAVEERRKSVMEDEMMSEIDLLKNPLDQIFLAQFARPINPSIP